MIAQKKLRYILYLQIIIISFIFLKSSATLNVFIDEYLALTSGVNFFRNLDFNAGLKGGGSYSVLLTSGPLSSVGSVIGWNLTNNLIIARFSNYLWALIIHLFFINIISKYYEINKNIISIFMVFSLIIVPWYFGVLYSIGEIVSTILFFYAVLLFTPRRNLSLILFSLSIFYGKLILIILFIVFYLIYIFLNKEFKKCLKDFSFFIIPAIVWIILVGIKYQDGSIVDYLTNFFYFNFTTNQSAGLKEFSTYGLSDYLFSYQNSEVVNWNIADVLRIFVSPIIFAIYGLTHFKKFSHYIKLIYFPLLTSTMTLYLWFWILSPTKWIRYSQHFILLQILFMFFLLSENRFKITSFYQLIIFSTYFSLFFNSLSLIIIFLVLIITCYLLRPEKLSTYFSFLLIVFLFINSGNSYYELNNKTQFNFEFVECKNSLKSEECYREYINQ